MAESTRYQLTAIRDLVLAPGPLAGDRLRNLQQLLAQSGTYVCGWQHRAQLLHHLRNLSPAPENSEAWQPVRDAEIARVEALTFPEMTADGAVLVELVTSGYGASVAAAIVVPRREWQDLKNWLLARPDESISNESLGGRTSDECTTTHALMKTFSEYDDPVRVAGFLGAFPDGGFGTPEFFNVLDSLGR